MLQEDLIDTVRAMTDQSNKLGQMLAQPTIQNPVQKNGIFSTRNKQKLSH